MKTELGRREFLGMAVAAAAEAWWQGPKPPDRGKGERTSRLP